MTLSDSWNRLLKLSSLNTIFLTYEWFSAFIKAFNFERNLSIILVYSASELVGILPLYLDHLKYAWFHGRILRSISNQHTQKYNFFFKIGFEHLLPEVLKRLQKELHWDMIRADFISRKSFMYKEAGTWSPKGLISIATPHMESPYILLEGDWETYYKKIFSKSLRKKIERFTRKAQRSHEISIETLSGDQLSCSDLQDAFTIEDSGWKGRSGTSILRDRNEKAFYEQLAFAANCRKWFALKFLKFDNKRIAFEYSLRYDRCEFSLKAGYDEKLKKFSPSHILTKHSIMEAFNKDYKVYDLLGPADSYKLKMANRMDTVYSIYYFNNRMTSKLLRFCLFDAKKISEKLGLKEHLKHIYVKLKGS